MQVPWWLVYNILSSVIVVIDGDGASSPHIKPKNSLLRSGVKRQSQPETVDLTFSDDEEEGSLNLTKKSNNYPHA
jgi:hypothetical protein